MKTFKRICIKDLMVKDKHFLLEQGKEYRTTDEESRYVTVFSTEWLHNVPLSIFAGEIQVT